MFVMENIIRSAIKKEDRLILIINEMQEDYILRLCESFNHNFFIVESLMQNPQWLLEQKPSNLHIVNSIDDIPRLDMIITSNRALSYEAGTNVSKMYHVPVVVLDPVTSTQKVPAPLGTNIDIDSQGQMFLRNGVLSVSYTDIIHETWTTELAKPGLVINPFVKPLVRIPEKSTKILIDRLLPQQYIQELPIQISTDKFTSDPTEARFYLHLWKGVTPLMYDCMASGVPVLVVSPTIDLKDIVEKKVTYNFSALQHAVHEESLSAIIQDPEIANRAKGYVSDFNQPNFISKWNNVFEYVDNTCYQRGIK